MSDAPGLGFRSAGITHPGMVRSLNEDALLEDPASGLWAVADGVGGHAAGDYASQLVVRLLGQIGPRRSAAALLAAVRERLELCNANLRAFAVNEQIGVAATTVVVLLCYDGHYAAVWAGDSRVYLWRDRVLSLLTRDHSEVQELVDRGVLAPEAALHHPRANVITRAIGADGVLGLDIVHGRILAGDVFLLCSDGVTKVLPDDELARCLGAPDVQTRARRLIDAALDGGAPDNATAVVVECLAEPAAPAA